MKLLSVQVGIPREVVWKDRIVTTGIFKTPVAGRVMVRTLNLEGDRQADLSVHGGAEKAVYVYPSEHYEAWSRELPEMDLPWGAFGENLTTAGMLESGVNIGDRYRIGAAEVMVTQPRTPCYKLGIRFGHDEIIRRFLESGRSGFYVRVLREGEVGTGDPIERIAADRHGVTVAEVQRLSAVERGNRDLLRRAIQVEALPEGWRQHFRRQLGE